MSDLTVMLHGLRLRGDSHIADLVETLLAEREQPSSGIEWEYGQSEVLDDGTIAFGAPVPTIDEAIRRRDLDRMSYPWPEELGVGRRRKAGPWEVVPGV
jgi:hypothetical protein